MDELRQPTTPLGVVNETLDDTIIINENRHEADYHSGGPERKARCPYFIAVTAIQSVESIQSIQSGLRPKSIPEDGSPSSRSVSYGGKMNWYVETVSPGQYVFILVPPPLLVVAKYIDKTGTLYLSVEKQSSDWNFSFSPNIS